MPETSVPWGSSDLKISMPENWQLQQVAQPDLPPAPADWPGRLALALNQPTGEAPLGELLAGVGRGRVALIVEDATRHSPLGQILPVVLKEVRHAGLADEQVEVFFANGMHPAMTAQQASRKLGNCCPQINWRCNRYDDIAAHVRLGNIDGVELWVNRAVATADLRIIISSIYPHLQAGFGGGYKMIFPGCAHLTTIRGLHRKGIGRRARQLVGTDVLANPMRRVIDAAGMLLEEYHGRSFAVHYIMDNDDRPALIGAGDVLSTHRMMAKQCSVTCGVVIPAGGDVLITNAHPRDFDLWQSFKCIANTRWAARANGVIICLTRCAAGVHGMPLPPLPIRSSWLRQIVRWIGPANLSSLIVRLIPTIAKDAEFFVRLAAQAFHRNVIYMVSPTLAEAGVSFPGMPIFATVAEAVAAADTYLGPGPQRVVVFPSGGTTFPVPSGADGGV